jgi:hypothetical protein
MWARKHCSICRSNFAVHPNAKTVDTRTRCAPCRKAMGEAKKRRQALQPDPYNMGIKGRGWKGLQPIDTSDYNK